MAKIVSVPGVGKFEVPDSATDAQITYFTNKIQEAGGAREALRAAEESQPSAIGSGLSGAAEQFQTAAGKAAQGLGLEGLSDYLYRAAEQSNIEASRYVPKIPTYKQIRTVGDIGTYMLEQGASSLPVTAAGLGGVGLGALAGGPAGALAGGSAAVYPFLVGANLQRQAQEQNIPIEQTSGTKAAAAAAIQAPLEAVVDRYFGGAIGKTLTGLSRSTVRSSFGRELVKSAVKGSGAEGLSESGQQAIEIGQANPEKLFQMRPEVQEELLNAAVAGGLLGGAMGGTFEGVGAGFQARSVNRQVDNGVKAIRAQNPQGDLTIEPISIAPGTKSERKLFAVKDSTGKTLQTFTRKDIAEEAVNKHGVLARVMPISPPPAPITGGVTPVVPTPPTGIGPAPITPPVAAPVPLGTPPVSGPTPVPQPTPAPTPVAPAPIAPAPVPAPAPISPPPLPTPPEPAPAPEPEPAPIAPKPPKQPSGKPLEGWEAAFELARIAKVKGLDLSKMSRADYADFAVDNNVRLESTQLRAAPAQRMTGSLQELRAKVKADEGNRASYEPQSEEFSRIMGGVSDVDVGTGVIAATENKGPSPWFEFYVNGGVGDKSNEITPKTYIGFDNSAQSITADKMLNFMLELRESGYKGKVRTIRDTIGQGGVDDQVTMYGATEEDANIAQRIADQFFGSEATIRDRGYDKPNETYSQWLAEDIKKGIRQADKAKGIAPAPTPPIAAPPPTPAPAPAPAPSPPVTPSPKQPAPKVPKVSSFDRVGLKDPATKSIIKRNNWAYVRNKGTPSSPLPDWYDEVKSILDSFALSFGFQSPSSPSANKLRENKYPGFYVGKNSKSQEGVAIGTGVIVVRDNLTRERAIAVAIHEFGHQMEWEKYTFADAATKKSIDDAYQNYLKSVAGKDLTQGQMKTLTLYGLGGYKTPMSKAPKDYQDYMHSFEEWFAEQVSRFLTQETEPVGLVEKFFKGIGEMWKQIYQKVTGYVELDLTVKQFLEGHWRSDIAQQLGVKQIPLKKGAPSIKVQADVEGPVISKAKKTPKGQTVIPVARSEVMPAVAPTVQEYKQELEAHANDTPTPGGTAPQYPYNVTVVPTTQADYAARAGEVSYSVGAERIAKLLDIISSIPLINRLLPAKLKSNTSRAATEFIMRFADKFLSVGQFVDAIRKAGGTVLDAFDPYLREELMHGIVNERLTANEALLYAPLIRKLKDSGISIEDMDMYLYALHATERNIRIANMGNPDPDKGSGMTDEDAADIIAKVKADPKFKDYEEARAMFRKIIDDTNKTRVEAGLIPVDMPMKKIVTEDGTEIDVEPYENYAPLRGIADEDAEFDQDTFARTGNGLNIRGREDIRALGRKSRASDIIAHAMLQNTEAVIRAEKNAVGNSLYDLVTNNKDIAKSLGVEIISNKPLKPYLGASGVIKIMGDPFYKTKPDVFVFKKDGKEIAIKIGNDQMARALISKPLGSPDISQKLVRTMAAVNRWFANINTGWNPEFMLTNLPRDLQTALINIGQYDIKGIEKKVFADVRKAIKASWRVIRDQSAEGEMEDWFREFASQGGMTAGISGYRSLDERLKAIAELTRDDKGTASEKAMKTAKAVIQTLEDANGAVENSIRLSVYKNLVQAGVSKQRAAQAAKNLTVNFDKRGEYGAVLNSLYLFFNASVQGTLSMGMALARSSKVRKTVAKIVVLGMMQDIINSIIAPEGEDGESIYDKIPDYKLKTNLILMDPTGATKNGYIAIPLPYGFNAFFNMGRTIGRASRGKYDAGEATGSIMGTFVDAFNPVGGTETFLNFLAPTTLDPVVSLATNTDFSGKKIFPTTFGGAAPKSDSQVYWSSTSPAFVNLANFLSKATGGGEYVPGVLEVKPDVLEYTFDYALGGVGSFIKRTFDTATNTIPAALTGDLQNIEVNNIPVFRRVVGNVSERVRTEEYMDQVNHVLSRGKELEEALKNGDPDSVKSIRSSYKDEIRIYGQVKQISNQRNRLATDLKRIRENKKMPTEQKIVRSEQIQKQMERLTKQVNELYAKNIGSKFTIF